jgi:hypothetical protein
MGDERKWGEGMNLCPNCRWPLVGPTCPTCHQSVTYRCMCNPSPPYMMETRFTRVQHEMGHDAAYMDGCSFCEFERKCEAEHGTEGHGITEGCPWCENSYPGEKAGN